MPWAPLRVVVEIRATKRYFRQAVQISLQRLKWTKPLPEPLGTVGFRLQLPDQAAMVQGRGNVTDDNIALEFVGLDAENQQRIERYLQERLENA